MMLPFRAFMAGRRQYMSSLAVKIVAPSSCGLLLPAASRQPIQKRNTIRLSCQPNLVIGEVFMQLFLIAAIFVTFAMPVFADEGFDSAGFAAKMKADTDSFNRQQEQSRVEEHLRDQQRQMDIQQQHMEGLRQQQEQQRQNIPLSMGGGR
jgi:hypothetical protein